MVEAIVVICLALWLLKKIVECVSGVYIVVYYDADEVYDNSKEDYVYLVPDFDKLLIDNWRLVTVEFLKNADGSLDMSGFKVKYHIRGFFNINNIENKLKNETKYDYNENRIMIIGEDGEEKYF